MIEIKSALSNLDYTQIAVLANAIWREHYIPIIGKPQVDHMLEKYQSVAAIEKQIVEGTDYFLIIYDDISVGYMSIKPESEALFLSKFYILKAFRGRKTGKAALFFVEEEAKAQQLKAIRLTVNINNTNAIKAYEKLGFKNIGDLVTDIGNGFVMDDFEMLKVL
tara:strand:+ start:11333 stop:11824 length:492 start_codon:yes stop_codon:yes gene_type:complete